MKKIFPLFTLMFLALVLGINAQIVPDYKISKIKVVPFEQSTGEFEKEITADDTRSFFNDLGKGLFVTVEISGEAGSFQAKRSLSVTVMEGKKVKVKKILMPGVLNENGNFYFPIYLEAAMCDEITITAKLAGQKTASTMTKKLAFMCGE